jgi:hypothetical protein
MGEVDMGGLLASEMMGMSHWPQVTSVATMMADLGDSSNGAAAVHPLSRRMLGVATLALLWPGGVRARVPYWGDRSSQPVDMPAVQLSPGQWVWNPAAAPQGPMLMVVNLDQQLAYVYRNAVAVGWSTVSSGKKGHETPTGVFHTLQKDRNHHSSIYDSAAMPYTQRLTWDGVALHAGGLPGYPSSHGCVHLPSEFAEALFAASPLGMTVVLARGMGTPLDLMHPLPISPVDPRTGTVEHEPRLSSGEDWRWASGNAPAGPLSVVVSRADRRLVVLRAGVEVGRGRVSIAAAEEPWGTHVFVAQVNLPHGGTASATTQTPPSLRWTGVAVPGHHDDAGRVLQPADTARIRLPRGLLDRLIPELVPGTTLVVTDAPVLQETTGSALTVLSNQPPGH